MSRRAARSDTSEYIAFCSRVVRAAGEHVSDADARDLRGLLALRDDLDLAIARAARSLNDAGYTWEQIGQATGTSRQAAFAKWASRQ